MELNVYVVIGIVFAIILIYYLYNEKNKFQEMLSNYIAKDHETFIDELTDKLSKNPELKNKIENKIENKKDLYDKYGVNV